MNEKLPESILALNQANLEARESMMLTVFNRRRYAWDIFCETARDSTKKMAMYDILNNMRYYFYSAAEQALFW